jgi:hypothetical protein
MSLIDRFILLRLCYGDAWGVRMTTREGKADDSAARSR